MSSLTCVYDTARREAYSAATTIRYVPGVVRCEHCCLSISPTDDDSTHGYGYLVQYGRRLRLNAVKGSMLCVTNVTLLRCLLIPRQIARPVYWTRS